MTLTYNIISKTLQKTALLISIIGLLTSSAFAQDALKQVRVANNVLSGEALGEFKPDNPENGNILARNNVFFTSENGHFSAGLWEAQSGSMTVQNMPYAEIAYIVEGNLSMNTPGESAITYSRGEGIVIPKGWTGSISIPEGGVKLITSTYTNGSLPFAESTAVTLMDRDTIDGRRFADFRPFDPDVSDIVARTHEFYRTEDQKFGADVWEAQPGEVPFADLGYDEMIYVLEGNMSFINASDGDAQIYSEGKAVVLPKGWSGTGVVSTSGARVLIFWYFHGER